MPAGIWGARLLPMRVCVCGGGGTRPVCTLKHNTAVPLAQDLGRGGGIGDKFRRG